MPSLRVEVVYALPGRAVEVVVALEPGATVRVAIEASGLLERFPEIDLARQKVGVHGELRPLEGILVEGDRVEIYRPLRADPGEARRRRVRGRR